MRKLLALSLSLASLTALAQPAIDNISRSDMEKVGNEFAVNFSHTAVAAPETEGFWGLEIGLVGGQSSSPNLERVVNQSGGDGGQFKNLYHAGLMARAHFPFEIFAEASFLPEQEISDVKVKARGMALGWNAGSFFNLPLDLSVGANLSASDVSFVQNIPVPNTTVDMASTAQVYWLGISKRFAFFTPYAKVGTASTETDVKSTGSLFGYTASQSDTVSSSGGYAAVGANVQLLFMRLGVEASQTIDVKRVSGKLSFAF